MRDVCIGCNLEQRPEQKDASIFVNTYEPVIQYRTLVTEKRDFCIGVQMEDHEKTSMAKELVSLKLPKVIFLSFHSHGQAVLRHGFGR